MAALTLAGLFTPRSAREKLTAPSLDCTEPTGLPVMLATPAV
ncbi:MAG: hypothetical protein ABW123_21640 [Cystobacter sp.]